MLEHLINVEYIPSYRDHECDPAHLYISTSEVHAMALTCKSKYLRVACTSILEHTLLTLHSFETLVVSNPLQVCLHTGSPSDRTPMEIVPSVLQEFGPQG